MKCIGFYWIKIEWHKIRQLWWKRRSRSNLKFYDATVGLSDSTMLGVSDSYKVREELGCKGGTSFVVSEFD